MGEFVLISWPSHAQHLCDGMWKSLQENYKTNFVMSVCRSDGAQRLVKAHQLILSIFCSAVKNTDEAILELDHQTDVDVLNFLLEFIYRGETKIAVNRMSNLKQAAKSLGFETLVESITKCENRRRLTHPENELKDNNNISCANSKDAGDSLVNSEISRPESEPEKCQLPKPRRNVNSAKLRQPRKELGFATSYLKHKLKVKRKLDRMRKSHRIVRLTVSKSKNSEARSTNQVSSSSIFNHDTQTCNLCEKRFTSKPYFLRHIRGHLKPETMSQCPHCECKYLSDSDLERHVASAHLKDMRGNALEKKYKCDECEFSAVFSHSVRCHKKRKHGVRSLKCDLCSYSCRNKADLLIHKRGKHSVARPFICETCGYRAKTKSTMLGHYSVHREKVRCDECEGLYAIKALKQHKRRVHNGGVKNVKCGLCSYETTCNNYLTTHLKNVHKSARKLNTNEDA